MLIDNVRSTNYFIKSVLDSIPASIAVLDKDSNIIAVNKTWNDFYKDVKNEKDDKNLGSNYLQVCEKAKESGENLTEVISGIKDVIEGKRNLFVHEYPCPIPEDETLWFLLRVSPLVYNNESVGAVIFHFDITDKKKAEQSIQKNKEKFRGYVENAYDIIFTVKSSGIFTYMSPNCKNVLGYRADEIVGKNFMRFVHQDDIEKLTDKLNEKAKEHNGTRSKILSNESIEYRAYNKFGDHRWLSVKTSLLRYDKNNFEIMGIARDITDQKQMEIEINQYYEELEYLYEELDKEINKAKEIHEKTLPKTFPYLKQSSISAFYNPAELIGGDFYNVIKKNNKLILYLSDVTGHGLDSTMMSSFIKNTINTYISLNEECISTESLIEFLAKQYIEEEYPDDFFFSISLAVIDLKTNELYYNGVGIHEPPLIGFKDGTKKELTSSGLPISKAVPWDFFDFKSQTIKLQPGTSILFATDGLAAQLVDNKPYKDRLVKTFYKYCHLPPEIILEIIKNDFAAFNHGLLQGKDDSTFLIFQLDPEKKKTYKYEILSEFDEIEWLIKKITPKLPVKEKSQQMLIAIHELIANAIEHGNNFDIHKKVQVKFTIIEDEYMTATIKDEGEGFDWENQIKPSLQLEEDVKEEDVERGRGISISKAVCDEIHYNYKGNKVSLVIYLK